MGKVLTAHNAVVKTAAVEVKALTIEEKQVTLAVFRQLKVRQLVDPDSLQLRGVPWGIVNYFPPPCSPDHLHVVWQDGSELLRACVAKTDLGTPASRRHKDTCYYEALFTACAYLHWAFVHPDECPPDIIDLPDGTEVFWEDIDELLPGGWLRRPLVEVRVAVWRAATSTSRILCGAIHRAAEALNVECETMTFSQLAIIMLRERDVAQAAMCAARERASALYEELGSLDQLFIAV